MEYVRKICPMCGDKFFFLKTAEEKAVYCTLEYLAKIWKSLGIKKVVCQLLNNF